MGGAESRIAMNKATEEQFLGISWLNLSAVPPLNFEQFILRRPGPTEEGCSSEYQLTHSPAGIAS